MQAAQELAGYSLGGADLLRRAMGKKIKEEMDAQREMFVSGAKAHNDVSKDKANEIFDQIAAFAGYGFNKSHAAAYALIAYWTAWLKANYPLEFMAASMTLDLGNTDKLSIFKQDLDRMDVELRQPDINKSFPTFLVEDDEAVRYALAALKGVGEQAMKDIVAERVENGPYKSMEDFAQRIDPKAMNKRQYERLTCAGTFDSFNNNRAQISASAEIVMRYAQSLAEERDSGQVSLFGGEDSDAGLGLPALPDVAPWDPLERLANEFAAVGFYLSAHPLDSRQQQFENLGVTSVRGVEEKMLNAQASRFQMAGVLLKKQERVSQKGNKFAFLQLSDPTGVFEVMIFSDLLFATKENLVAGNTLLMTVEAEQKEDQIRYMGTKIEPLDAALEGKIRQIQIHMNAGKPAHKIKEFLDIEGQGLAEVMLNIHVDQDRVAQVKLPGRWSLSSQARNIIRAEDGVQEILEA